MTLSPELEQRFAKLLKSYPPGRQRSAIVPMLLYGQDEIGSVTQELVEEVARRCSVTVLQVDEVIGYYSMLHRKPLGKFHVQVCTNIACQAVGGEELYAHAARTLRLGNKEVTPDGLISLEEVECMGACSWAPAIQINYDFHHFVTPERFDRLMAALRDGSYHSDPGRNGAAAASRNGASGKAS
jgi:NADH-quinone oxidoreductase subunit E